MTRKNLKEEALSIHESHAGKIEVVSKIDISSEEDLSLVYTPGVADVCKTIAEDPRQANTLTSKGNMVAIVTDGTAVLGLGDIGPEAAIPVMEGKSMLFKKFAGIDAFPLSLDTKDVDEIVTIIKALSPSFGGINLEDISAPRCFEIEKRLKKELDIPVFHDDQHGTAIVVLGALVNALKVVNKSYKKVKIVINGAGAAGIAIAELLLFAGYEDITLVSLEGVLCKGEKWMNATQEDITLRTNLLGVRGELSDAIKGADVFIGVSGPGALKKEYIKMMNEQPIVFAMANPIPEIYPEEALEAGASIVGTGRSDYPNQVNNLLAFPGIFRGALDAKAKDITMQMKVAASYAIADVVSSSELNPQYIIPNALDPRVAEKVGESVRKIACKKSKANSSVS
ncbi:NAD(P)-dependent malic enzyme [Rossellomorea yichunensis]|jgi:malate dehydrogenase (oxaloacetate-decarboxylating)|uniref:NAD(P)-dependent malic enzyme n=1 Tax=Rossellomorea yichunensis TaxID=3077331 RepID=UPI0028DE1C82|nr:NADP-dependent malic enzyme [Rossellomorea sp. YC4-1]MDT9023517.1 NADP-dependent malic enzyme [Rossellomorea sp. YC4-1]